MNNNLTAQIQSKMDERLAHMRIEAGIKFIEKKMLAAAGRIKERPALAGDTSWSSIENHDLLVRNRDDSGATVMGAATGIPGVGGAVDAAASVAEETASRRKATRARPQDDVAYSAEEEAKIRDDNAKDIEFFHNMERKLELLKTLQFDKHFVVQLVDEDNIAPDIEKQKYELSPSKHEEILDALAFRGKKPTPGLRGIGF